MNNDQVEGKVKDVAGRIERQAGEWTGEKEKQAHGALTQVEGKVQNAWATRKKLAKGRSTKGQRTKLTSRSMTQLKQKKMFVRPKRASSTG